MVWKIEDGGEGKRKEGKIGRRKKGKIERRKERLEGKQEGGERKKGRREGSCFSQLWS